MSLTVFTLSHVIRHMAHVTRHTSHVTRHRFTSSSALWDRCSLCRPLLIMIMSQATSAAKDNSSEQVAAAASTAAAWSGVFIRVLCRVTCLNGPFALQAFTVACEVCLVTYLAVPTPLSSFSTGCQHHRLPLPAPPTNPLQSSYSQTSYALSPPPPPAAAAVPALQGQTWSTGSGHEGCRSGA